MMMMITVDISVACDGRRSNRTYVGSELAKVAAAAAPVPEGDFQAAEVFDGSQAGFAFRAGPNGVGFYKDQ